MFNHARFNSPGGSLNAGTTYGIITTAQDPRSWAEAYVLPPRMNMMKSRDAFISSGTRIFAVLEENIKKY